jgi:hypothetical protein
MASLSPLGICYIMTKGRRGGDQPSERRGKARKGKSSELTSSAQQIVTPEKKRAGSGEKCEGLSVENVSFILKGICVHPFLQKQAGQRQIAAHFASLPMRTLLFTQSHCKHQGELSGQS